MAGHSKWAKIKHQKAINDNKKGKVFSKLAQQISISARDGGGDPSANFSLRLLMDKAKAVSMPADNVKRAIDRGTGKSGESMNIEFVLYEGFGPDGVAMLVETVTDNRNRTVTELRIIFNENGGSLGESGSVSWNFDQKGYIVMRPAKLKKSEKFGGEDQVVPAESESVMMELMEIDGIMDIEDDSVPNGLELDNVSLEINGKNSPVGAHSSADIRFYLYTDPKKLTSVRDQIASLGYIIESAELIWSAKTLKEENEEKVMNFIDKVEELDEVQNVFTDLKGE